MKTPSIVGRVRFRQSDFISLRVACNLKTQHLPGERLFALMKPASFVINTTRGAAIDEAALVRAL